MLKQSAMLPDFPEIKNQIIEPAIRRLIREVFSEGIIGQIRRIAYFEGEQFEESDVNGRSAVSPFQSMSAESTIDRKVIGEHGPEPFLKAARAAMRSLHDQQTRALFQKIHAVTTETGNVVDARGAQFSSDLWLELVDKTQMTFDDDGTPDTKSQIMVVSPEMARLIEQHAAEWEADPNFREKYALIVERQRREWIDRESNRKLVD